MNKGMNDWGSPHVRLIATTYSLTIATTYLTYIHTHSDTIDNVQIVTRFISLSFDRQTSLR